MNYRMASCNSREDGQNSEGLRDKEKSSGLTDLLCRASFERGECTLVMTRREQ